MILSGLLELVRGTPAYDKLIADVKAQGGRKHVIVLDAAKPYLAAALYHELDRPMLLLTARPERAREIHQALADWLGPDIPLLFPELDVLPYEHLSADSTSVQQRLKVLDKLVDLRSPSPVVSSVHAAWRKTISASDFLPARQVLRKGMKVDVEELLARWIGLGYRMESTVELPGTASRRGGILDVYPAQADSPARIELFGNEIDSIRFFDPATQRSREMVQEITIVPAREMLLPTMGGDCVPSLDLSSMDGEARGRFEEDLERLLGGQRFDGVDFYYSIFNQGSLFDYLPDHSLIVLDEIGLIEAEARDLETEATEMRQVQLDRGELPGGFPSPYFTWDELAARLQQFKDCLALQQWDGGDQGYAMGFASAPSFGGRLPLFLEEVKRMVAERRRLIVVSQQASRLSELLEEQDIFARPVKELTTVPAGGSVTLVHGSSGSGWLLGETILLSDLEVFGFSKRRRVAPERPVRREAFLSDLKTGDYVVHVDHGVGRFAGLTRLATESGEREYLVLEYAAGDKLYVPSDQADRVGHYVGPGGYVPPLTRLGTQEWNRAKQKVKEATQEIARELLKLYSEREVVPGYAFSADTLWQQEFEASFPYAETPDQLQAIEEVKRDMEKSKPMDRLVCGDVGYGKTEVALRAAFKAAMDGVQVAVLVPTTVLAQQHFNTFSERMAPFPVKIEMLSRFRSPKEQQTVIEGLAGGTVDICIGTHRLLQKDVSFENLGLVIIDEEQRFGVAHKERLKHLRKEVDVMTLSATPIPRTLHMSLAGVRDMSLMETPPEDRLPVKTYVSHYDDRVVREAILRELDRNGQVFFVHNRVDDIGRTARRLQELLHGAKIAIGHGQMSEETLESVMVDFARGKTDVLVCTTIIESGLDLPNVNTLIVDDADRLGLTQLYQLRGRVGRGANRAYAYFLYRKGKYLTDPAQKRLQTIFEATELGSGFRIAMKDLEIRGAGNVLGHEQSGKIGAVGFDLYTRLLAESVEEIKADGSHPVTSVPETSVDLSLDAYIPPEYIDDIDSRLALYVRMARLSTMEGIDRIRSEIEDRYGPMPEPVENLLYLISVKLLASRAGIRAVSQVDGHVALKVGPEARGDRSMLDPFVAQGLKIGAGQLRLAVRKDGRWRKLLQDVLRALALARDSE